MARLFISYKREDQAYAFALRQWLIDAQEWPPHEVFVDLDKLHAGDAWAERIFREAEACEAMLFLASERSVRPDSFCYKELQRARGITIAVTLAGLSPDDERLRSALPHGADARQITALDGQPTAAFEYVSPVDGKNGAIAMNRAQVESIAQTLRDLGIAPNSFTWKSSPDGPYRGLGALQEGDEALFFGRDREIRDCIRMLEQIRQSVSDRALVIQAPSGAGKSSMLRAGLWRRLRRHAAFSPLAIIRVRQAVLSHEEWGLAAGLAKPEANILNLPLEILEDRVSNDLPELLTEIVDADASRTGGRRTILLGIDQAEEIAALSAPQELDEYRRLFTGLTRAAASLDIRLVLTARDDSIDATLDHLAYFGITQEAIRTFRLHRMPVPRFKDVIEKPALVATGCGFPVKIDEALSTALAQAAAQNEGEFSDALPILALALQRLVRKRRAPDGSIKAGPDIASRLVSEAVSEATRDALLEANADEAALRRLMVPRLVTWDPRAGEGGAAKRRVATSNELFSGDRHSLVPLADALVNQRLLTRAGDNYEVSHEALLRVAPLGSLLLELRSKFLKADMLIMEAHDWMEYGRRTEWVARTGERLRDAIALVADSDFNSLLSTSTLGVSEYLAACDDKDRHERELRERLDRYELANLTAGAQPQNRFLDPTNVMPGAEIARGNGLKVYISYSRQDALLSDQISNALNLAGFESMLDRKEIAAGEDWGRRIEEIITGSDKLVILVSPEYIRSEIGRKDLEIAAQSGKAFVPVLVRDVPLTELPSDLAKRNIIFMRNDAELSRGMPVLAETLATDFEWVREHTQLQRSALLWTRGNQGSAHLLRGEALMAAERWLANRPAAAPLPTEMQRAFIHASRRVQLRRSQKITATAISIVVIAMTLSAFAFWQRFAAVQQMELAQEQSFLAKKERFRAEENARRAQSLEDALRQVDPGNPLLRP